jgi:membrane associated rhomboid family serine protease
VRRRPAATPVVTITLIAICVVVYLVQQADPAFTGRYALIPYAVEQGQYARLVTSAFLHASVLHLATNMITLYIVGAPLERVLRQVRYLIVYFLSAIGGSLFSVWLSPEFSIGVGASGAIFGLFGALVVLRRQVGAEAGALAVLIGLNLVISFTLPNISWQAHIGGLVTGVLVALALRGIDRVSRRRPAG